MDGDTATKPMRVLIVDDEPLVLRVLARVVKESGYEVGTAETGVLALVKFQECRWDVVLTDHRMPGLSGDDLAVSIWTMSPDTPVVLMSGDPAQVKSLHRFHAVVVKPFQSAEMLKVLASAIASQKEISRRTA